MRVEHLVDCGAIAFAVRLDARSLHCRALAAVEHAIMDCGCVGGASDQAIKRIHLAYQMPLAQAADGRVAGHGAHGRAVEGEQRHRRARARCCSGRLTAGMAAADHDHIIACSHAAPLPDSGAVGQKRSTWNIVYLPMQNPEKSRSSMSSVPACPVSESTTDRPSRSSSAVTSRSRAALAAWR